MSKANFIQSVLLFLLLFTAAELDFSLLDPSVSFVTNAGSQEATTHVWGQQTISADKMPLAGFWELIKSNILVNTAIRLLLTLFCGLYLSRIAIGNMIFIGHTYTPLIIFTIVSTCIFDSSAELLTVSALLITSLSALTRAFKHGMAINELFTAGFGFGMAVLVYPPTALFFIALIFILPIFGRNLREYLTTFTGFLLPIFLTSYVYWAVGHEYLHIPQTIWSAIITSANNTSLLPNFDSVSDYALVAFVVLLISLICYAIVIFTKQCRIYRERPRRAISACWIYLITCTAMLFLPSSNPQQLSLIAIPLSIILSLVANQNSRLATILYPTMVIYALIYNIVA